jgi:hypothetical protein
MTTVIDTPEGINMYRMLTLAHSLAFEINYPGMKMTRVSALKVAKADGLTKASRKPAALRDVIAAIQAVNPEYVPEGMIARMLNV